MYNEDIIEQIERKCEKVIFLSNGWGGFIYHRVKYVYIPDSHGDTIKMAIPYITKIGQYDKDTLEKAIVDVNREVKFVKIVFHKNGNVSMRYDYKIIGGVSAAEVVKHMIETMYVASEYFMLKLQAL